MVVLPGGLSSLKKILHEVEQVLLVSCEKVHSFLKEVESSGNPNFHCAIMLNVQVPPGLTCFGGKSAYQLRRSCRQVLHLFVQVSLPFDFFLLLNNALVRHNTNMIYQNEEERMQFHMVQKNNKNLVLALFGCILTIGKYCQY